MGANSNATGNSAVAVGNHANSSAGAATSLGYRAHASEDMSVALGSNASTTAAVATNSAEVNHITYAGFAGNNPISVVSVGGAGDTRQVQNVAAGQINTQSTDAINGSQLYMTQTVIGNVASSTAATLGNVTVDANGNISANNIGGTGANTVNEAVNVVYTEAKKHNTVSSSDSSVTVKSSSNKNGSVNYDLSVKAPEISSDDNSVKVTKKVNASGVTTGYTLSVPQYNTQINNTNNRISSLENTVRKNRKRADAGAATAHAATAIPQVFQPGKSGFGAAIGGYRDQSAVAVGYSRASDNARHVIKTHVAADTHGGVGYGAGYLFQW